MKISKYNTVALNALIVLLILFLYPGVSSAQFGKNKVQYKDLNGAICSQTF
jgi:hypothetical protein